MMRLFALALLAAACRNEPATSSTPTTAPPPSPAPPPTTSVPELIATTMCDWYWRSSAANARPYDSLEQCLAENTVTPAGCSEQQARACAAFARDEAQPGSVGLTSSPDCVACMNAVTQAQTVKAFAEEKAALDRAKLTVHSATLHKGAWPADLRERRNDAALVVIDVELASFGYRIDPDDFVLVEPGAAKDAVALADSPYAERLTRDGRPVDWRDPSVIDDPDLRMRAFFPVPKAAVGKPLVVEYNGKQSSPFTAR